MYCALRSFLRLYTSPVAHEAMRARLRELKWDPKGVAENQAAWTEFVDEYGLVAAMTAHLDLTKRLAPLTWALYALSRRTTPSTAVRQAAWFAGSL